MGKSRLPMYVGRQAAVVWYDCFLTLLPKDRDSAVDTPKWEKEMFAMFYLPERYIE